MSGLTLVAGRTWRPSARSASDAIQFTAELRSLLLSDPADEMKAEEVLDSH